jgi:diguanylate cyclase (GGDEF)-like protein
LPAIVLLVMLNLAMNIVQTWRDFNGVNDQAARRLDSLASAIALRVQDRGREVDHTFMVIDDAIQRGTLDTQRLGQIARLNRETLGDVSIAVFDPAGRVVATSNPTVVDWVAALHDGKHLRAPASVQPVHYDSGWGLLFVREHRDEAGSVDARIAIATPIDQGLMEGMQLPAGSAVLLRDSADRVIARYPSNPGIEAGSVYRADISVRQGPTSTTYYALSPLDERERLGTSRVIAIDRSGDSWGLDAGYAVDEYRLPWRHSLYINLMGMVIEVVLLVAGIIMLRRESRLYEQIETWAGFASTVIRSTPTPIALVDRHTGRITLANETLGSIFGARAAVGECFASLFADPASWHKMGVCDASEPVAMQTCAGSVHMIVRWTDLQAHSGRVEAKELMLVTLNDVSEQYEQIRQLRTEADFDPLTKLPNRRNFLRACGRAVVHAQLRQSPLTVLALDVDHFKSVNDTWGHAAGDRVLEVVAERFNAVLRDQDLPARVGGEEFAAILQGTTAEQALAVAERIRQAVARTPIAIGDGRVISVTASIGMAMYQQGESSLSPALARADAALYRAKRSGRNRVEADGEVEVRHSGDLESVA